MSKQTQIKNSKLQRIILLNAQCYFFTAKLKTDEFGGSKNYNYYVIPSIYLHRICLASNYRVIEKERKQ